jgi:hypothetical protein
VTESLHLGRCHPLTDGTIDQAVTRTSPGNYALGYVQDGVFVPFYVGRSDSDVNDRLHAWVGVDSIPTRYCSAAKAAWGARPRHPFSRGTPALRSVGAAADARYTHFEFSYAASAEAAFERECRNYHDLGGGQCLDNPRHPAPPGGVSRTCPDSRHHQAS